MNFYKNVIEHRGKLLVRGIHEGKEYKERMDFSPTLYAISPEDSKFFDILRACLLVGFSIYYTYINVMEDEWRKT